jgi:hypothetical protein
MGGSNKKMIFHWNGLDLIELQVANAVFKKTDLFSFEKTRFISINV